MTTSFVRSLEEPKMARDLIKFFDDQRKSYARYLSSVDCLLEKYEDHDVIEDEMQSVIDLSTNQIHKGKSSLLLSEREFDSVYDQSMIKYKEKDNSVLMNTTERSINTDFLEAEDTRGYVKKFLEEDEPEPSEGDTLSSVSSCSYPTLYSDYEDESVQDDLSADDQDCRPTDNPQNDEVDGDIPGTMAENTRQTRTDNDSSPDTHRKLVYDDRNRDQCSRIDETYLVVQDMDLKETQKATEYHGKTWHKEYKPELNYTELQSYHGGSHPVIHRTKVDNDNVKSDPEKTNVKRVSTIFLPFSELKGDNRNNSNKNLVFNNKNKLENKNEGLKTENSLAPKDRWWLEGIVNQKKEERNVIKLSSNDYDTQEQIYDSYIDSTKDSTKQTDRNLIPKPSSEHVRSSYSDLSLSFRVKGSPQLEKFRGKTPDLKSRTEDNYMYNANSDVRMVNSQLQPDSALNGTSRTEKSYMHKDKSNVKKLNTPLHHRQARGMLMSKWQSSAAELKDNNTCNETELDSFHDDNRSSRKDSGFGTLNEDSLTNDTPVHEELPEVLSLQNLDTFNKSLADQSAFLNVSVNCPADKTKESAGFVEKWLKDVSIEMENVCETSLDREVDRLSQEVCKNVKDQNSNNLFEFGKKSEKAQSKNIKQRDSGAENARENVKCLPSKMSMSSQLSKKTYRLDQLNGRENDFNTQKKQKDHKIERHILKVHRNSTLEIFQRLKDEQVAEMMKNCDKNTETNRRRYSDFTGKRFIDQSDGTAEMEDITDVLPTPPKSRKLNDNRKNILRNSHGRTRSYDHVNGDKHGFSGGERKIVDRYIDQGNKNRFHDNNKPEMLAYMLHRDLSKKPPNKKLEFDHIEKSRNELPSGNNVPVNLFSSERNMIHYQHNKYHNINYGKVNTNEQGTQTSDRKQGKKKSPVNRGLQRSPDEQLQSHFNASWQKSPERWHTGPETQVQRKSETRRHISPRARVQGSHEAKWQRSPETQVQRKSETGTQRSPKTRLQENHEAGWHRNPETQRNIWALWQGITDNRMQGILDLGIQRNSETGSQKSLGTRIQEISESWLNRSTETSMQRNFETGFDSERSPETRKQRSPETRIQRNSGSPETRNQGSPDTRIQMNLGAEWHRSPEKRQRKGNERQLRIQNVCMSPSQQYRVNQSYIRKLNCRNELEESEDNVDDQYFVNSDDTDRVYERNENHYRDVLKPSPQGRNKHSLIQAKYENSKSFGENKYDLNERETVSRRLERYRPENEESEEECLSASTVNKPNYVSERSVGHGHYRELERDDETYHRQRNACVENSSAVRNSRRKYVENSKFDLHVKSGHNYQKTFEKLSGRNNVDNDNFFEQGMFSYESDKELHRQERQCLDDEESLKNNSMSAKSQGKGNHGEHHFRRAGGQRLKSVTNTSTGNRSPHQQRHNYAFGIGTNSITSGYNDNNMVIMSPSSRQNSQDNHGEFRSPSIQRARASNIKEDVFSPSTSLAKMRLNTPESKSNHRSKQHRRGQSRDNDFNQKVHLERTLQYDLHVSHDENSFRKSTNETVDERFDQYSERANEDFSETSLRSGPEVQSTRRFVSLDQIQGMPLQLRIQQLEARHCNEEIRGGQKLFRNRETSNQYICDQTDDTTEQFENVQDNSMAERSSNSNVYHKYCEVINENKQNQDISQSECNHPLNREEHNLNRSGQRLKTIPGEQKSKKSLFAPTCDNRNKLELPSGIPFDAFKIPIAPMNVPKNKLNHHNKENEHTDNRVCPEKTKSPSIPGNPRRESLASNPLAVRRIDKMTLKYLQSTPIKPGCEFRLNTTMSTILGSEDTEVSSEQDEEIVLL